MQNATKGKLKLSNPSTEVKKPFAIECNSIENVRVTELFETEADRDRVMTTYEAHDKSAEDGSYRFEPLKLAA